MAFESGTDWRPEHPELRGRHGSFADAVAAARRFIENESGAADGFFDTLADEWQRLFPGCPARPGRRDGDCVALYVRSAPVLFSVRPRLAAMKRAVASLPGAPKRLKLVLEIHS